MKKGRFTEGTRVLAGLTLGLAMVVACGGEIKGQGDDLPAYGGQSLPDSGSDPYDSIDGGAPTTESGVTIFGGDDAGINVCADPVQIDGGCAVSFSQDILDGMFSATGTLGCGKSQCHAATSGLLPIIDVSSPRVTYLGLAEVNTGTNLPYINPCSTDVAASEIVENLDPPGDGNHMPQDNPSLPDENDLAKIVTWVQCGAPFN